MFANIFTHENITVEIERQSERFIEIGEDVVYSTEHRNAGWFDYHAVVVDWFWQEANERWMVTIWRSSDGDVFNVPAEKLSPYDEFVADFGEGLVL